MNPQEKVILLSGANRGIGLHIARQLSQEGYQLSLGVRNPSQIIAGLENCHYSFFDARDASSARQWVTEAYDKFQRIDAVVHCAGLLRAFFIDDDESILDDMWDVNVKGTLRICRESLPYLKQAEAGKIINLVSMSGKRVKGKNIGYAMTKYAQLALSQGLKNITWEDGIRVTSICPSWVNTDMAAEHSNMAAEDMTQPEDIAALVSTLLKLPKSAAIGELAINCHLETF